MEENLNVEAAKFEIKVPYNNQIIAEERKKSMTRAGIFSLVVGITMAALLIASIIIELELPYIIIFGVLTAIMVAPAIWMLIGRKPNPKDDNKSFNYFFYEDYLKVDQDNGKVSTKKNKSLENCLYRNYKNKQYISTVNEYENRFQIQIYTGTYNGVAQHSYHTIPKACFDNDEQLAAFTDFIKNKVKPDYAFKEDKKKK